MPFIEVKADLGECARQLKRIADLLEDYIHPQVPEPLGKGKVEITRLDGRGRWEAEREDRRLRGIAEEVAQVSPRR